MATTNRGASVARRIIWTHWLPDRFSVYNYALATLIMIAASTPGLCGNLDLLSKGDADDAVLTDGLPNEHGEWRTKVQLTFDPKSQRIERRTYEYFDPAPSRHLDVAWYPQDGRADKPGRVTGRGRFIWRERDRSAWDRAGIVSVFTGQMRNGRPNGTGELVTRDGRVYKGSWREGRANGFGRLKLPSGEEYAGSFRDGMADGKGREFDVTGEAFEGSFREGLRNGQGKSKLPSGFYYDSRWVNGVESFWSRRIRLAQVGGPSGIGGGGDIRMGVTVLQRPSLPEGVDLTDVVPYGSSNDGNEIIVQPADEHLMDVWKGDGELQTFSSDSTVRSGIFEIDSRYIDAVPPTFVLEFQNHSAQTVTIEALRLEVSQSDTDNEPAIQMAYSEDSMCGGSYSVDYDLENFGWSPAKDARMRLTFTSPGGPPTPQVTKSIGDLIGRLRIDFESELRQFHVNVNRLKQLRDQGFPCPSGGLPACLASIRSNPLFGTLGPQLTLNDLQIVVPVTGFLDYDWTDNTGAEHSRSSPFKVNVGLGKFVEQAECGEGSAPEPIRVNAVSLRLDAMNYTVPLTLQYPIAAGQMVRFTLPITAAKSSDHAFRIVATLSDRQEISSLPIQLLYYRPRPLQ